VQKNHDYRELSEKSRFDQTSAVNDKEKCVGVLATINEPYDYADNSAFRLFGSVCNWPQLLFAVRYKTDT
jgi:hypothetical protein